MAYGQNQAFIAIPQPGTTNTPFAIHKPPVSGGGWFTSLINNILGFFGVSGSTVPPFVPVNISVIDFYGGGVLYAETEMVAILELISTTQIGTIGTPGTLLFYLSQINTTLAKMNDSKSAMSKSLSDLSSAIGTLSVSKSHLVSTLETATANQILANNFAMAASGEKPEMPPIKEQLKEAVSIQLDFSSTARTMSTINGYIDSGMATVTTWISNTETYRSMTSFVNNIKDSVLAKLPPSIYTANVAATSGKAP
jgi:hypothetical protein